VGVRAGQHRSVATSSRRVEVDQLDEGLAQRDESAHLRGPDLSRQPVQGSGTVHARRIRRRGYRAADRTAGRSRDLAQPGVAQVGTNAEEVAVRRPPPLWFRLLVPARKLMKR